MNQKNNRNHRVALAVEGAVLSESATVWLGFASAMVLSAAAGLRSGKVISESPAAVGAAVLALDAATLLGVSLATAKRRWAFARAFLYGELGD